MTVKLDFQACVREIEKRLSSHISACPACQELALSHLTLSELGLATDATLMSTLIKTRKRSSTSQKASSVPKRGLSRKRS